LKGIFIVRKFDQKVSEVRKGEDLKARKREEKVKIGKEQKEKSEMGA
jgi:hypothetical protein